MLVLGGVTLLICSFLLSTASPPSSWWEDVFLYGMFIGSLLVIVGVGKAILGLIP